MKSEIYIYIMLLKDTMRYFFPAIGKALPPVFHILHIFASTYVGAGSVNIFSFDFHRQRESPFPENCLVRVVNYLVRGHRKSTVRLAIFCNFKSNSKQFQPFFLNLTSLYDGGKLRYKINV